jgi:predicted membrane channel-forming protein YqfA (hemolysin III family)
MKSYGGAASNILFYVGMGLMGVFWIWSIVKVLSAPDMKPFQKRFWMISVIAVPVLGGLIFHIMHRKPGKIIS